MRWEDVLRKDFKKLELDGRGKNEASNGLSGGGVFEALLALNALILMWIAVNSSISGLTLNIVLNRQQLEQVEQLRYLGSLIDTKGGASKEIKAMISKAWSTSDQLRKRSG
jgi:hypothetical protein